MLHTHLSQFLTFFILLLGLVPLVGVQAVGLNQEVPGNAQLSSAPTGTPTPLGTPTPTGTPAPPHHASSFRPFDAVLLDDFNRGTNSDIGGSWTGSKSGYSIVTNQLVVGSAADTALDIFWNTSFGADQEASITFVTIDPNAVETGLLLKAQTNSAGADLIEVSYNAAPNHSHVEVWTHDNGTWVRHGGDILVSFAPGDKFSARANAYGQVEVYKNDVFVAMREITSWSYYANDGYIGLFNFNAGNMVLDDFGGGSLAAYPSPTPMSTPCYDPQTCDPVASYPANWVCDIPGCSDEPWVGAVIAWPSWSAYPNNARTGTLSRTVHERDSDEILYPYMGPWANGCEVTAVLGTAVIIEWQRGTDTWTETKLEVGESHTITLVDPQDNAMIEGPNNIYDQFRVSLSNCTPQDIFSTPTPTPSPLPTSMITMGETTILPSSHPGNLKDTISAQQATLSDRASLQSISLYVNNPAGQLRLGLYGDIGNYPGNLIKESPSFPSVAGWNTYNFPSPHVTLDSGNYWLAFLPEDNNLTLPFENTGTTHFYPHLFGNMLNPFPNLEASGTFHYSIYATFIINDPTNIALKTLAATPLDFSETLLRMTVLFLIATAVLFGMAKKPKLQNPE